MKTCFRGVVGASLWWVKNWIKIFKEQNKCITLILKSHFNRHSLSATRCFYCNKIVLYGSKNTVSEPGLNNKKEAKAADLDVRFAQPQSAALSIDPTIRCLCCSRQIRLSQKKCINHIMTRHDNDFISFYRLLRKFTEN